MPESTPEPATVLRYRTVLVGLAFLSALTAAATSDAGIGNTALFAMWTLGWWVIGTALAALQHRLPRSRFAMLTYGGVLGIMAQLTVWALATGLGISGNLPIFLLVLLTAVCVLPPTRQALVDVVAGKDTNPAASQAQAIGRIPTGALAGWSIASSVLSLAAAALFRVQTLPPGPSSMYQDLYWHLGIAAELKRHVLPHVVESRVGRLNYHWLSDAYMASGSLGSHVQTMYVAERLWVLPILLLSPALIVVVGRQVSGSWSGSWLALLITTVGASVPVLPWQSLGPSTTYAFLSPSQVFGVPMTLFATSLMVAFYRSGHLGRGGFAAFTFTSFLCAGSKSSILPVFLGGTCVVLLTRLRTNTLEQRRQRGVAAGLMSSQLVALAAAAPLFAGGSAGSKLRIFGHLRHWDVLTRVTGHAHSFSHGPFVPPGLNTAAVLVLIGLVYAILLSYGLGAFALLIGRRTGAKDPVPSLLMGAFLASVAAFLLIDHTGGSESYFPMGAMPILALLAGWGWSHIWEHERRVAVLTAALSLLAGLTLGALLCYFSPSQLPRTHISLWTLIVWLGLPLIIATTATFFMIWRARHGKPLATAMLFIVGLSLFLPSQTFARTTTSRLASTPHVTQFSVTPDEARAAAWIRDNTASGTLVATNIHCRPIARTKHCMSSAYWTSALMERRLYVGSWGYTDGAQRNAGLQGLPAVNEPYPDKQAFDLNEAMFYTPSRKVAEQLKKQGVSYLYADSRVAPISHALSVYSHPVHTWGSVSLYRL